MWIAPDGDVLFTNEAECKCYGGSQCSKGFPSYEANPIIVIPFDKESMNGIIDQMADAMCFLEINSGRKPSWKELALASIKSIWINTHE